MSRRHFALLIEWEHGPPPLPIDVEIALDKQFGGPERYVRVLAVPVSERTHERLVELAEDPRR